MYTACTSASASSSSYEPYAREIPSFSAARLAESRFRDATASTSQCRACCMAGMTRSTPIVAVLKIPQRIFVIVVVPCGAGTWGRKCAKPHAARGAGGSLLRFLERLGRVALEADGFGPVIDRQARFAFEVRKKLARGGHLL